MAILRVLVLKQVLGGGSSARTASLKKSRWWLAWKTCLVQPWDLCPASIRESQPFLDAQDDDAHISTVVGRDAR